MRLSVAHVANELNNRAKLFSTSIISTRKFHRKATEKGNPTCKSILAPVTYWFPGPNILSTCKWRTLNVKNNIHRFEVVTDLITAVGWWHTWNAFCTTFPLLNLFNNGKMTGSEVEVHSTLGHDSVPHAMAATAWAPPAFKMWVAPAFLAQYNTSCKPRQTSEIASLPDQVHPVHQLQRKLRRQASNI